MRRSTLACVLAASMLVGACSSDNSNPATTEANPTVEPAFTGACRQNGLIAVQLAGILPAGAPLRLLANGLARLALVEAALVTRKTALAQTRALDLIDFITKNRNNLINAGSSATLTKLANVTDAILCLVGLPPTGVTDPVHTGIGVVPANNVAPIIITTPQGDAGLRVPIGGTPTTVVVTVTAHLTTPLNTPLDQYGQTVDLTASQDVLWQNGGVTVALCVTADDAIFNRLRVGHEGGLPADKFGAIEILPEATAGNITAILGNSCGPSFGSRAGFQGLKRFAQRLLLPDPLYALAAATTVGGKGGTATKFSKFRAVDPLLEVVANPALPASTEGAAGEPVAQPPSVLVRTKTHTVVPGIPIKFKVADGSPGTIVPTDPATVTTGATGVASATSWTLGFGANTATATAVSPVPAITFDPAAVTFNATGTGEVSIVLTWGEDPSDLDGHLTGPIPGGETRFHVYYAHKGSLTASPFAAQDQDVTTSYGPETFTIAQQFSGVYRFSVHDYSNLSSVNSLALAGSGATVTLHRGSEETVFNVPDGETDDGTLWTVFELNGSTVIPINSMGYTSDPDNAASFSVVRRGVQALQTDRSLIRDAVTGHSK
jgi:hypothetical protein